VYNKEGFHHQKKNHDDDDDFLRRGRGRSVAAPTAGLHFTEALLDEIQTRSTTATLVSPRVHRHHRVHYLSHHIDAGTFQPVVVKNALNQSMYGDDFEFQVNTIQRIAQTLLLPDDEHSDTTTKTQQQ